MNFNNRFLFYSLAQPTVRAMKVDRGNRENTTVNHRQVAVNGPETVMEEIVLVVNAANDANAVAVALEIRSVPVLWMLHRSMVPRVRLSS